YSDAGRFREAAETLDRAAELDPYESGHAKRLETLRGRIDEKLYSRVANRFQKEIKQGKARAGQPVPSGAAPSAPEAAAAPAISGEAQAHVLEDLILQAELYMQYGMKAKALEGVERIHKQFPREELKNEKLRHLYASAGFTPHYKADAPAIPANLLLPLQIIALYRRPMAGLPWTVLPASPTSPAISTARQASRVFYSPQSTKLDVI